MLLGLLMLVSTASLRFHVAPLQCYTNRHLRALLRLLSSTAVLWTEMEKADTLVDASEQGLERRLRQDDSGHVVLQLGGNDAATLARATRLALPFGYSALNLNCGCPSIETGGASFGATLMRDATHTRSLAAAMADEFGAPVSIKCRLGAHESLSSDGSVPADNYERLVSFASAVLEGGCVDHLVVHARSAILGGLSPAKNRCVPPLRHDLVHRLAADVPSHVRVTLNGGLSLGDCERAVAASGAPAVGTASAAGNAPSVDGGGLDGVMSGRAVLRHPFELVRIDDAVARGAARRGGAASRRGNGGADAAERCAVAVRGYEAYGVHALAAGDELPAVAMPLLLLQEHLREAASAMSDESLDADDSVFSTRPEAVNTVFVAVWEATAALMDASGRGRRRTPAAPPLMDEPLDPEELPFRPLSKMLAQAMGKQVANKVVRNRREDVKG